MTEVGLLQALVLCTFILAPRMTSRLFLGRSRLYDAAHAVALVVVLVGIAVDVRASAAIWPVFCALGFVLHLRNEGRRGLSVRGVARGIPFVFSLVSAAWFVAGRNDLHMLGYDPTWSYYATLHGGVLGWIVVGCAAHLATRVGGVYLWVCYLALPLFLLVAFGIDGVPHFKRIGAVGISTLVPVLIGRFALDARGRSRSLALVAFFGVVATMILALLNELWAAFPRILFGMMPTMVLVHGCVNALLVAPAFYLAIAHDGDGGARGERAD